MIPKKLSIMAGNQTTLFLVFILFYSMIWTCYDIWSVAMLTHDFIYNFFELFDCMYLIQWRSRIRIIERTSGRPTWAVSYQPSHLLETLLHFHDFHTPFTSSQKKNTLRIVFKKEGCSNHNKYFLTCSSVLHCFKLVRIWHKDNI